MGPPGSWSPASLGISGARNQRRATCFWVLGLGGIEGPRAPPARPEGPGEPRGAEGNPGGPLSSWVPRLFSACLGPRGAPAGPVGLHTGGSWGSTPPPLVVLRRRCPPGRLGIPRDLQTKKSSSLGPVVRRRAAATGRHPSHNTWAWSHPSPL